MDIKGLIALAFGTLGLGITEYVAMGLLPYLSADFSVTIAQAGHAISAYALGVAIGAFMIIFMRKLRLKSILLILILIHLFGNALTCVVDNFNYLLISRSTDTSSTPMMQPHRKKWLRQEKMLRSFSDVQ